MSTADKIDLFKLHKAEYAAPKKPVFVEIGRAGYLTIDGRGEPGGEAFASRIGALYGMAFTVKMTRKFAGLEDYVVCKLEAQWWCDDVKRELHEVPKDQWQWKLLIRTPEFIGRKDLVEAVAKLTEKGKGDHTGDIRLESFAEGRCVQMLLVGPYEREPESVARMREFAEENGCVSRGPHHEIYLSDPRRVPPERLKTILRMPVRGS